MVVIEVRSEAFSEADNQATSPATD